MNKPFKKSFIFFIVIGSLLCCSIFYINKYYEYREYFNPNAMEIRIEDTLDLNKVNIYWSCAGKKGQLIKKGKDTGFIYKEYGKNKFLITYGKDTIKVFKYFKFNNWHGHKHLISLSKENDKKIAVKVEVFGPDTDKQKIY